MTNNTKKSIYIVAAIAIGLFLLIGGANWTDRNYKPGSYWPYIWGAVAVAVVVIALIIWVISWTRKK